MTKIPSSIARTPPRSPPAVEGPAPASIEAAPALPAPEVLRRLGVDPATRRTIATEVLGPARLSAEPAVRVDGKVLWFDADLCRTLGFSAPASGELTPELEAALLDRFAYRTLAEGEEVGDREVIEVYADRYGGSGTTAAGSGRAAFIPELGACLKGLGRTKLAGVGPHGEPRRTDYQHSHGNLSTRDALTEAIWGQVADHLFTAGSSRVLCLIDTGHTTKWPDGSEEPSVIEVRVGHQLRPAHLLLDRATGHAESLEVFARMTGALGLRIDREGGEVDVDRTMGKLLDRHAQTAAEQFGFRVLHGAISTSNMLADGGQLDLTTMTTQDRTAPISTSAVTGAKPFGREHLQRAAELERVYAGLVRAMPSSARARAGKLDVPAEFRRRYEQHLERVLVERVGFRTQVAKKLAKERAPARALREAVVRLAELENPGPRMVEKQLPERLGVVDVFNALRFLPERYAAVAGLPGPAALARLTADVRELLRPDLAGDEGARAARGLEIDSGAAALAKAYLAVMRAAERKVAGSEYGGVEAMRRALAVRARFENEPIPALFKATQYATAIADVEEYRRTGDRRLLTEAIDKKVALSLRKVDALYALGERRPIEGGHELERRSIDGVTYAVRAFENGDAEVRLEIPLSEGEPAALPTLPGAPKLSRDQIVAADGGPSPLRFRYTTDDWATSAEVGAKLERGEDGRERVVFPIPMEPPTVGRLEGVFRSTRGHDLWIHHASPRGDANYRGYTYAVPDSFELKSFLSSSGG